MRQHISHIFRHRDGQSIIEFALIMPVVLLFIMFILFCVVEVSSMMLQRTQLTSAAREGARVAAISHPFNDANAAQVAAVVVLTNGGIKPGSGYVIVVTNPDVNKQFRVTITMIYAPILPILNAFFPGFDNIPLKGETIMVWEG